MHEPPMGYAFYSHRMLHLKVVPKLPEVKAIFLFSARCCLGRRGPSDSRAAEDEHHVSLPEDAERGEAECEGAETVSRQWSRGGRGEERPKGSQWEDSR